MSHLRDINRKGVGKAQSEVRTLPNLNLTNFGKFFVTDIESQQQFVQTCRARSRLPHKQRCNSFKTSFPPQFEEKGSEMEAPTAPPSTQPRSHPHLMGIHEVHDEVKVPMHGLVLSQLWLHLVQPVDQGLQSIHELA